MKNYVIMILLLAVTAWTVVAQDTRRRWWKISNPP